jgi:hypothetical protein
MKFFKLFDRRYIFTRLANLSRDAAIDSFRNILSVFGAASILGTLAVVKWYFILPGFAFLCLVWYMDYLRHDFHPIQTAMDTAETLGKELKCTS